MSKIYYIQGQCQNIYFFAQLVQYLMVQKTMTEGGIARFRGVNFEGQIKIEGNSLFLEMTQFKKGAIYQIEVNKGTLDRQFRNYLIFKNISDLFDELVENQFMEITDEGCLIVPIQIIYKSKTHQIKIVICCEQSKFDNEAEKLQKLYDQIARMSKEQLKLQKLIAIQHLNFKGDKLNPNQKSFQITNHGKKIKMLAANTHTIFYHHQILPQWGIFSFKFKVVKTISKYIFVGICGKEIKGQVNAYHNASFIGLYLCNGQIYANKTNKQAAGTIGVIQDTSIFKLKINMNEKLLEWYIDEKSLFIMKFSPQVVGKEIYPFVNLYSQGDIVQFIYQ